MTAPRDEVQVWLVPDQRSERVLADLFAVLDADERRRAEAYRSDDDRRRFVLAHGAVRYVVAGRLGAAPAEIRWARGPYGKPELAGPWRGAEVNLSHSGDVAMVALSDSRRVGVDVQRVLPHLDAAAMAARYFPPEEAAAVRASRDRATHFAHLWSRKEALTKAHGGRLAQGLRIPVTPSAADPRDHPDDAWSTDYRITDVPAPPGYRAAVALSGQADFRVTSHHWTCPPPPP